MLPFQTQQRQHFHDLCLILFSIPTPPPPHLSVKIIGQQVGEAALDGVLVGQQRQVVGQLVLGRDDGAVAGLVELRSAGAPENLHHVQNAQVDERAVLGIVDIRALGMEGGIVR